MQQEKTSASGHAPGGGRDPALSEISRPGWRDVLKQTWVEAGDEDLGLVAAGVAFYAFLALVPLISAIVLTYGLVAEPEHVAGHITALARTMPDEAAAIVGRELNNTVEAAESTLGIGLLISLGLAIYGAMRGASAMIRALNVVFNVEESRPLVWHTAVSVAMTLGFVVVFVVASLAISALAFLQSLLPDLGSPIRRAVQLAFWLGAALAASVTIAAIYDFAPNREVTRRRWLTPGSAVATAVWIAATLGFAFYVRNFGSYSTTYGALGAIVIFLTWLYLSAYILLLGAELNQVLERRRATGRVVPDALSGRRQRKTGRSKERVGELE